MYFYKIKILPLDLIVHNNKEVNILEKRALTPASEWSIYKFYKLYSDGNVEQARNEYFEWYKSQYFKYKDVEKKEGGMKGGSLDRKIKKSTESSINELNEVISERVLERFNLIDNIKLKGYIPDMGNPVRVFRRSDGKYMLFGGHHRVAALKALGYIDIEGVFVFKNYLIYKLFNLKNKFRELI